MSESRAVQCKADFEAYLQRSGVIDALTRSLCTLYQCEDRQSQSAMDLLREQLSATPEHLSTELSRLRKENEKLKQEVARLQEQLGEISADSLQEARAATSGHLGEREDYVDSASLQNEDTDSTKAEA
ncbi:MAG: hypothetical protein MHM6MM_007250 [Cercozoa sp. M6MM]